MPKACDLKRGAVVEIDGEVYVTRDVEVKSPSSRSGTTLYKVRFAQVQTKQKRDETFKGDDLLKEADFLRREVQYSYRDGDTYVFMDNEDFTQYALSAEDIEDRTGYLTEGLSNLFVMLAGEQVLGIELPASVTLEIIDTAPSLKGSSATGRTKPARLETGLEVQVPEYLSPGERIRINTESGRFMARA